MTTKKKCQAIAKSTQKQCENKSLIGADYCWMHYPKKSPLIFLLIGAILSLVLQVFYDNFTVSDEEKRIIELTDNLEPFIKLAENYFPDLDQKTALTKLQHQLDEQKNTIRELIANVKIRFSGDWSGSPSGVTPIYHPKPLPHYFVLTNSYGPVDKPIRFYPDPYQLYDFTDADNKSVYFTTKIEVPSGQYPVGKNIKILESYDHVDFFMPLGMFRNQMKSDEILIEGVEFTIIMNGEEKLKVDSKEQIHFKPFKDELEDHYVAFGFKLKSSLYKLLANE